MSSAIVFGALFDLTAGQINKVPVICSPLQAILYVGLLTYGLNAVRTLLLILGSASRG